MDEMRNELFVEMGRRKEATSSSPPFLTLYSSNDCTKEFGAGRELY